MKIFDAHCDTIYELREKNMGLRKNNIRLDIERMAEVDTYIQVFAAYIDKKNIRISPMEECLSLIEKYNAEIEKNKDLISIIKSKGDLTRAKDGGCHSILAIEGGEALEGDLSALKMYYDLGVRLITLTWNYSNELADGIYEERGGGLTEFGKKALSVMQKMGMVVDVSHLSEKGFWDVVKYAKKPFVASHSCVKSLCAHPRNLDDAQIDAIINGRGCIGINFYPLFLSDSGEASIKDVVRHIEYILNRNGENTVGLGSDFDGTDSMPRNLNDVSDMKKIVPELKALGLSEDTINKICFENFYRIFSECM